MKAGLPASFPYLPLDENGGGHWRQTPKETLNEQRHLEKSFVAQCQRARKRLKQCWVSWDWWIQPGKKLNCGIPKNLFQNLTNVTVAASLTVTHRDRNHGESRNVHHCNAFGRESEPWYIFRQL